jgi:hypothetical protein
MAGSSKPLSAEIDEAIKADQARTPWYKRGEALFNPSLPDMRQPDAIDDLILSGWAPTAPFIGRDTRVTFVGGCYGGVLANHLKTVSFAAPGEAAIEPRFILLNETLSTSFALRQMFEWEFEGIKPDPALTKGNRALEINYSDELWKPTLENLAQADVYVLLISSAEIWQDEPTGAVLWREVPGANPARQKFRTSTVEENRANLRAIYALMRKHRPGAKLICALSPIPIIATYRRESCIHANIVSKAVLCVAMDEFHREVADEGHLFYWPLYDVALEGFGATPYGGHFNGDRRHVNDAVLNYMLVQFEAFYCQVDETSRPVLEAFVAAKVDALELPAALVEAADRGDRRALQHLINHYERIDDQPTANLVARYAASRLGPPAIVEEDADWIVADLAWQVLPGLEHAGVAPQILAIPATACGYGAASASVQATGPGDLLVRVRLEVIVGAVGVMLIRPDGSALSDRDHRVLPEDGLVTVQLRIYPQDGPAHLLLRNYDNDDVAGTVDVREVATRRAAATSPAVGSRPS